MRRRIYQVSSSIVAALLMAMVVVPAQSSYVLVGTIPFDFHVGQVTLPSGQYSVKSGFPTSGTICIQSKDRAKSAIVQTLPFTPSQKDGAAKLVFNRYGSDYFLAQVWNPSDYVARELPKSRTEMEVARNISKTQNTVVALEKR